jgi:3-mercaptopyruvate sulfurtransferase SseA
MRCMPIAIAMVTLSTSAWARTPPQTPTPPPTPGATAQMPAMEESHRVKPEDIDKALAEGKVLLLDVREPRELEELGTLPDSVNIPLGQLEKRLGELPKDRLILTA